MDMINVLMSAENMRTLLLLIAIIAGVVWLEKRISTSESRQNQRMDSLVALLRQEINGLGMSLRQEMDERFTAFHKTLKENDFAHIAKTIEALTFMLQKNGFLKSEDKIFAS